MLIGLRIIAFAALFAPSMRARFLSHDDE